MSKKLITVAVVDDHPMIRELLSKILPVWGYKVIIQAVNGKDLLSQLRPGHVPDICTLDVNMPEMNGYETIKRLKKDFPRTRTLIYTMNVDEDQTESLRHTGADAVVSKTASIQELKSKLEALCPASKFQLSR